MRFQRADRPRAGGVRPAPAQPVLALTRPGDAYEREADRVAHQVADGRSRISSAPTRPSLSVGQRDAPTAAAPPGLSLGEARGGGHPLPPVLRSEMEQSFRGASFAGVRVHADARADRMSRSIQAQAFTSGRDIFFREGAFDPKSHRGRELIAHELTHVVHQTSGDRPPAASPVIQRYMADDWADAEASTARAQGNRNDLRGQMTRERWTGAAHVSGAVLEYKGDNDNRKVKDLGAEVSGNPKRRQQSGNEIPYYKDTGAVLGNLCNSQCSEKRVLSTARNEVGRIYNPPPRNPTLYLATEWTACGRCEDRIDTLQKQIPSLEVFVTSAAAYQGQQNPSTWAYAQGAEVTVHRPAPDPDSGVGFLKPPKNESAQQQARQATPANMFDLLNDLEQDEKGQGTKKPRRRKKGQAQTQAQAMLDQSVSSASSSAPASSSGVSVSAAAHQEDADDAHAVSADEAEALEESTGLRLTPGKVIRLLVMLAILVFLYSRWKGSDPTE